MTYPTDRQIVFAAFTDDEMTVAKLCHRTGLSALRVNNALDELTALDKIHIRSSTTWSLHITKKGSTDMSNIPTPPAAPAKKATKATKAPAAKKAPKTPKPPKEKKDGAKHAEIEARDTAALAVISKSKAGVTKDELAAAMGIEIGLVHMSLYRLNRDGKIAKTKGEGRQARWIVSG